MNEEIKRVLLQSVRVLKSNGGMDNKEVKPVIVNIEKLIRKRRPGKRVKRA
jgi:hypothetical protein